MPHESTVAHEQRLVMENPQFLRSRQGSVIEEGTSEAHPNKNKVANFEMSLTQQKPKPTS